MLAIFKMFGGQDWILKWSIYLDSVFKKKLKAKFKKKKKNAKSKGKIKPGFPIFSDGK